MTKLWAVSHSDWSDRHEVFAVTYSEDKAYEFVIKHAESNGVKRSNPDDPRYDMQYNSGWYFVTEVEVIPDD